MSTVVIVGTQWGDEGKGMVVDLIAQQADMVVRYQGGDNAGHTVVVDGQATKLHNIPSGVLHEGTDCVIGDGVVINPRVLLEEIAELKNRGLLGGETSLRISRRAHVILPWHMDLDRAADAAKVMEQLTNEPAYLDMTPQAIVKLGDTGQEQFSLNFQVAGGRAE